MSQWLRICSVCRNHNPVHSLFMTYHIFLTRVSSVIFKQFLAISNEKLSNFSDRKAIKAFLLSVCWKHLQIVDCKISVHHYNHQRWSVLLIDCVLTSTPLYHRFVIKYFIWAPSTWGMVCVVPVDQSLVICLVCFIFLFSSVWPPLHCLSFFELWPLTCYLVRSNFWYSRQ